MARLAPTPEAEQAVKDNAPLSRYGRADEIGDAAVYLSQPGRRLHHRDIPGRGRRHGR